jgi:dihydroneopterin aldolase
MGLVALEGMQFEARHGYYAEEQQIGGTYRVDVYLQVDFKEGATKDELAGTVNYETIYRIAKLVMSKNAKLIETLAQQILDKIAQICTTVSYLKVRVIKMHPPLGGQVERAYVEIEEDFKVQCGQCKRIFLSHQKGDCWTKHGYVYPETKASLIRSYGPHICLDCLQPHLLKETKEHR